jgi:hypothetical protein
MAIATTSMTGTQQRQRGSGADEVEQPLGQSTRLSCLRLLDV